MNKRDIEILSFSLNHSDKLNLERLQKNLDVKSRSKLLRMALDSLASESKMVEDFKGTILAILTVTHLSVSDARIAGLSHDFDHLIRMQMHTPLKEGCVELFFLEGNAADIRQMYSAFRTNSKVKSAKIFVL